MIAHNTAKRTTSSFSRGSILAYTLLILVISSILFSGFIQVITSQVRYASKKVIREQSLQVAEAGIYFYRWYLAHQVEGRTKKQIQDFWASSSALGTGEAFVGDYEGIGQYSLRVIPPTGNSTIAIVESTGHMYSDTSAARTIRVRFRQPSWSEYSVLCDGDIRFGDGTDVRGPIHSNGGIRFDGVAHNKISSARTSYDDPDTTPVDMRNGVWTGWANEYNTNMHSGVFLGGKEFPKTGPSFNGVSADLAFMKEQAGCATAGSYCSDSSNGENIYLNNDGEGRHIILKSDGTMTVQTVKKVNPNNDMEISTYKPGSTKTYAIPDDGLIFVEDNVWVEGAVDGKRVTIVAADMSGGSGKNIYLKNDILYTHYDGTDAVGLIAQNNISVVKNSENDLRIDAALLAQNGRVGRSDYGSSDHRSSITIYGAIATRGRYGFSWTDGHSNWGYETRNLIYDNNFLYMPPPYFPTGTHYAIDLWEEV